MYDPVDFGHDLDDRLLEVDELIDRRQLSDNRLDDRQQGAFIFQAAHRRARACQRRLQIRGDEFHIWVNADRVEYFPRYGIEKRLVERDVNALGRAFLEILTNGVPNVDIGDLGAHRADKSRDTPYDPPVIELNALDRVALAQFPLTLIETSTSTLGDITKLLVVVFERVEDFSGSFVNQGVVFGHPDAAASPNWSSSVLPLIAVVEDSEEITV